MNFEEFLKPAPTEEENARTPEAEEAPVGEAAVVETAAAESIEVQKAVVESLAAEKVEQDEIIADLRRANDALKGQCDALKGEIAALRRTLEEKDAALANVGDVLAKNADSALSNKVALLDRDTDVPDRFPGETREHVLEVIREARDKAEADGCSRRAQVLEGVLMANEPEGTLAERRAALEKLFADNGNIVSGPVIAALEKMGISHKKGEDYLLPSEIIKRTY
jgi:hypothetical protein